MPELSQSDDISQRRERIYSELVRANRAALGIFIAVILLAGVIVFAAHNAQRHASAAITAKAVAQQELWRAQLAQARATRQSIAMGRRTEAWKALTNAASFHRDLKLRNEAIAALATPDIRQIPLGRDFIPFQQTVTFDSTGDRYFETSSNGVTTLRRTSDHAPLWIVPPEDAKNWYNPAFSAKGRWLFVMLMNGDLVVWDLNNYARVKTFPSNAISSYEFSGDDRFMCIASPEGKAQLYKLPEWTVEGKFAGVSRDDDMELNEDGSKVALRGISRPSLTLVESRNATNRVNIPQPTPAFAVTWHPNGELIATAGTDQRVRIYDTRTGQELRTLSGHHAQTIQMTFVPGRPWLLTMSWDGTSRLWDTVSGEELVQLPRYGDATFLNAQNLRFGWRYENNSILELFQIEPTATVRTIPEVIQPESKRPSSCALSFDDDQLATASPDGIRTLDPATGALQKFIPARNPFEPVYTKDGTVWFASDRKLYRAVSNSTAAEEVRGIIGDHFRVSEDASVIVALAGQRINELRPEGPQSWDSEQDRVETIALSPDGRWIATGTRNHIGMRVWDAKSGKLQWKTDLRQGTAVAFMPDNRSLVTTTTEACALWDAETGKQIWEKPRATDSIMSTRVAVSPNGKLIAVANTSTEAMLLDPATGAELATLKSPNPRYIAYLNFSGAGKYLAVTYEDRSIQLWNLAELNTELAAIGLDWNKKDFEAAPLMAESPSNSRGFLIAAAAGVLAVVIFGLGIFSRHRRLLRGYLDIEALAVERQEQLRGAEKELARGQKMTALGTLAAGVAHDFNNLLSVIRMANTGIARTTRRTPEIVEDLQDIEAAVVDGKRIVQSMLGYTRDGVGPAEAFAIGPLLEETVRLLSRQFLSGLQVHLDIEADLPNVVGYPGRLRQMLLNLVVNASEAMNGKGHLWIEARSIANADDHLVLRPSDAARFIAISVRDSGPGIDHQTRSRIFEPFFTTKMVGTTRGTGLGLSLVYTMAEQDGLGLHCESAPGQGAAFTIFFPVPAVSGSRSPTSRVDA